ncbi:HEAT repeat domain-containing protein, partial [Cyanobacteria bacterium FACHB-63]|nr:HEAT repeat domain-containing protein [Cyanobacteria bacterium FACHB-63]
MSSQFQLYLESIRVATLKRQEFYVSTNAKEKPPLDLMAKRVAEKKRQGQQEEEFAPVPVLEGIRTLYLEHKHVLLVGRPGSGKSTALDQLLIEEVTRSLEDSSLPIPVLVQLRSDQPILELIRKALRRNRLRCDEMELDNLLFEGKLLLLLDGVNEIPRWELHQELQEFREDNPNVTMVFTTRDLAVGGDLGIEKQLEMQPLTPAQLREFVGQWFPERTEEFLNQLSDRLKKLGETPLLLAMLCDVFQRTGKIPENLGLVFQEFTHYYERNLKEGVRIESDRAWWKPVLQQLAWVMMQGEKPTEFRVAIRYEEAVGAIAQFLDGRRPYAEDFARKCLRDLQKHHLIQPGTNKEEVEFRHQLIQEYYVAECLLKQLPTLSDDEIQQNYLNYLNKTEPLALMLALVEEEALALRVVRLALEVDWVLGARLAGEAKLEFQKKTVGLVDALEVPNWLKVLLLDEEARSDFAIDSPLQLVDHFDSKVRCRAAEALDKIGSETEISASLQLVEDSDSNKYEGLKEFVLDKIESETEIANLLRMLSVAAVTLGKTRSEAAIPSLLQLVKHSDPTVRCIATEALGEIGSETVIPTLLQLVEDCDLHVRRSAISVLGEIGSETVISTLLQLVEDSDVRESILSALGKLGNETAIFTLLQLMEDSEFDVLDSATVALCRIAQKHTNMLAQRLPQLLTLIPTHADVATGGYVLEVILAIQENCKYYNHEIYQAYLEAQKADRQTPQNNDRSFTTIYNIDRLGILNTGDTTIQGDQIG